MKINFNTITNINRISFKSQTAPRAGINANPILDTFIRNNNVSFTSSKFNETYPKLKQDLCDYILSDRDLTFDSLNDIIHKYRPNIDACDFKDAPKNSNITEITDAYFRNYVKFAISQDKGIKVLGEPEQALYIEFPKSKDYSERAIFASKALHESTHMLQQNSPDRISKLQSIKEFLVKEQNPKRAMATIQAGNLGANITYDELSKIYLFGAQKVNEIPIRIKGKSSKNLDSLFLKTTQMDAQTASKQLLVNVFDILNKQFGTLYDKKYTLNTIIQNLLNEKEAYDNGYSFLKEALNIVGNTDLDLKPMMLGVFCDAAKNFNI